MQAARSKTIALIAAIVFICKETLRNPVSEVFPFEFLHENKLFSLGSLHLKSLGHMDMVANINPLLDLISEQFLFFSAGNFLAGFVVEYRVLVSENGVGWRVKSVERIFLEQRAVC